MARPRASSLTTSSVGVRIETTEATAAKVIPDAHGEQLFIMNLKDQDGQNRQIHAHNGNNWHQVPSGPRTRGDQRPLSPGASHVADGMFQDYMDGVGRKR